jgi:hypothetical protein
MSALNTMSVHPLRELGESPLVSLKTIPLSGLSAPCQHFLCIRWMCVWFVSVLSLKWLQREKIHSSDIFPIRTFVLTFYLHLHFLHLFSCVIYTVLISARLPDVGADFLRGFSVPLKKNMALCCPTRHDGRPEFLPLVAGICLNNLIPHITDTENISTLSNY